MPNPHISDNFGDLLDPRFQKIFFENYPQLNDMLPELYNFIPSNGRDTLRWSEVGTLPDWDAFTGSVNYKSSAQGYDTVMTPIEFASGIQIERKLFDDDQFNIMNQRPKSLATSARRTRQKDGALMLNNAFSVDTTFYVNSEAVALCSNSHTTNSGASTSVGFDNLVTTAFSATALASAQIQSWQFRGDQAELLDINMDEIWYPPALYEKVFEVISSMGKVETANNNRNVHHGAYTMKRWNRMTDSNNWFIADSTLRVDYCHFQDRVSVEFAFAEDLDTIIAKWRGYQRYGIDHSDWRWILGAAVS